MKEVQEVFHQDPKSEDNEEHQEKLMKKMLNEVSLVLKKVVVHIEVEGVVQE
jgi:hypothetical protein